MGQRHPCGGTVAFSLVFSPDLAAIRAGRHLPPHLRGHLDRCQLGDDGRALHLVRAPGRGMMEGCKDGCWSAGRSAESCMEGMPGVGYRGEVQEGCRRASVCRDGCIEGCSGQCRMGEEGRRGVQVREVGVVGILGARECRKAAGGVQGAGMGAAVQGWMQMAAGCWRVQGQCMGRVQVGAEVQEGCRGMQAWMNGEGSWDYRRVLGTGGMQWGAGKES